MSFSKLLTDSDTYYANGGFAEDQGNRRLEKSIGQYDQTHVLKMNTMYELPFGKGRRWLTHGFASQVLGGWRLGRHPDLCERLSARGDPQQPAADFQRRDSADTSRPMTTGGRR